MTNTKIKSNFNGVLQIDRLGIKAYDLNYIPIKFNIIFNNDYFEITNDNGINSILTYEWNTDYVLEELIAIKSILHIDIPLYEHFTLYQQNSTVYLYHDYVISLDACLKNAVLISKLSIRHLTININDSIVKGLLVCFMLNIIVSNHSTCYLEVDCKVITKIKMDTSSLFYINDQLITMYSKL